MSNYRFKPMSFKQFSEERLPEYDIQPGSQFAAQLELAYDDMVSAFKEVEYRYQRENSDLRDLIAELEEKAWKYEELH